DLMGLRAVSSGPLRATPNQSQMVIRRFIWTSRVYSLKGKSVPLLTLSHTIDVFRLEVLRISSFR
ncbi:MAG: hypothetical protein ACO3T7_12425, partial [Pseudomonadales bacterium]